MKCLHFAFHRTSFSIGSCLWLLLILAKLCDIKAWHCKISSQTHLLLGNLDLHTKRNLDLRFCHPTLKCLHSAFHRTISSIGTRELPHGLCSSVEVGKSAISALLSRCRKFRDLRALGAENCESWDPSQKNRNSSPANKANFSTFSEKYIFWKPQPVLTVSSFWWQTFMVKL